MPALRLLEKGEPPRRKYDPGNAPPVQDREEYLYGFRRAGY